jgi:hypothetical protein
VANYPQRCKGMKRRGALLDVLKPGWVVQSVHKKIKR